ncbi:MAG: hypothetical protein JST10_00740 [Bacteroidetes bacterium]|nr:hypothetical protein [Bacteroidota bacterium]MBS1631077.1 hypothetical protein [Bacteroidota bacterium]
MRKTSILISLIICVLFSIAQTNLPDSLIRKRIHDIDSFVTRLDSLKEYKEKQINGNSEFIGYFNGYIYISQERRKNMKTVIDCFFNQLIFYSCDTLLLKLEQVESNYYCIDGSYYDKSGIKEIREDQIQRLDKFTKAFKSITILLFLDEKDIE